MVLDYNNLALIYIWTKFQDVLLIKSNQNCKSQLSRCIGFYGTLHILFRCNFKTLVLIERAYVKHEFQYKTCLKNSFICDFLAKFVNL